MTVPATRPVRTGIGWRDRLLPVAVALALVAVLSATAPDLTVPPRQWVPLAAGEQGTLRDFTLQVTQVRQASAVDVRGEPLTTTAVFVVVGVEADVLRAPVNFTSVALQTRSGDRYDPRPEWVTARPPMTQPGFTVRGTWVFEVPPARLIGARLLVENDPREFDGYDRGLRIDLGLAAAAPSGETVRLTDASTRVTR